MDAIVLLPLLVALVPVALFFALVRRRRAATPEAPRPEPRDTGPATDFGLARDSDSQAPAPAAEPSGSTAAGAAAAAGGALILGYGASHRAASGGDGGAGHDEGGQDGDSPHRG